MIIKRTISIFLFLLNLLLIGAMFVGKATAWISPEQSTLPVIFGLFFPYFAIINAIFIVFWIVNFKWRAIIPIVAMLLVWSELQASFSFFKTSPQKLEDAAEIKVMSYNVFYFGYYKDSHPSLDYIVQSDADIVCLQEFGYFETSDTHLSWEHLENKMAVYPYRSFHLTDKGGRTFGLAIYSKYPIVNDNTFLNEATKNLPMSSRRMYADIKIGNDTLRVFNTYMKSNTLNKKDKTSLFAMAEKFETAALDSVATNIFSKIGTAARIRAIQSEHTAQQISDSPYPVIVCGDFNDTPVSYTYNTISEGLTDSFVGSGAGMGITYHEDLIRVRIDYLLHSKEIISSNYQINKVKYSDHYPVQASLWLKKNNR